MMEIPEGKVSLLDAVPVRCGHITTEGHSLNITKSAN